MADNPNTDGNIHETGGIPELWMTVSPAQNVQAPVDKTLSISEMAADAKATGDAINNLGSLLEEEISDLASDVIPKAWITTTLTESGKVADAKAVGDAIKDMYPVGSIYMTIESTIPSSFSGIWTEILLPMTWNDLKNGTRSYASIGLNPPEHTVHFFLRTA